MGAVYSKDDAYSEKTVVSIKKTFIITVFKRTSYSNS